MNIVLWVFQIVLAVVFVGSGGAKLLVSEEKLRGSNVDIAPRLMRLLGVVQLLGAIGLILPGLTGIAPLLTPVAATGLAVIMAGAAVIHLRRREFTSVGVPAILLILTVIVAVARFGQFPL